MIGYCCMHMCFLYASYLYGILKHKCGGTDSQEAVKLKPTFADAYLNLGNVYKVSYCSR